MEGNEQGPNRESTKEQATQRRNNTGQADVFQTPVDFVEQPPTDFGYRYGTERADWRMCMGGEKTTPT